MDKLTKSIVGISTVVTTLAFSTSVKAQQVDLELGLLLDGSGSISSTDFNLQVQAYQNIFTDPTFYDTYISPIMDDGGLGQIAVSTWQFSSGVTQEVDWTLISDQASAEAFGNTFAGITQDNGFTNTGGAINDATASILSNSFDGDRLVLDLSTDGEPTTGPDVEQASIDSIAAGVDTINAIGIGTGISVDTLQNEIIRGDGAFFLTADTFAEFETGLATKLEAEITNGGGGGGGGPTTDTTTPEPASIIGLFALGGFSLIKRKKAAS